MNEYQDVMKSSFKISSVCQPYTHLLPPRGDILWASIPVICGVRRHTHTQWDILSVLIHFHNRVVCLTALHKDIYQYSRRVPK